MKIDKVERKALSVELTEFDPVFKEHEFIEVCMWSNWEGYDITIDSVYGKRIFALSNSELQAINFLVNHP